ncbi:structural maintenance of chromosomes protein 3-like isoform X2 [Chelonus insularis]|uniref:structural maintenance of chromosomes protein 3-like isoform X2 n=1 Tax=Chelonus insularis TaxID=460826 RepID=UPI00158C2786|nr:structural maintenance of chromosomes protein 3-like isoform X2 [Chelonus insularis]
MFITGIIVEGFKAFGTSTYLGEFFPGINAFVGLHGSGKTSVLDAIEFVLGKKYINLTTEQFNALICRNTKKKNKNFIKIEIFFNNFDRKYSHFPCRFSIVRHTTLGMDLYTVNERQMYRKEFSQLVEYLEIDVTILKAREVIQFATSSNNERLDLLFKMIHYKSSIKSKEDKLHASGGKRNETIEEINKCYDKLEKEYNFCQVFQQVLKNKELIIYGMEKEKIIETKNRIKELEVKLMNWLENQGHTTPKYMKLRSELNLLESQLIGANNSLQLLKDKEEEVINQLEELKKQKKELAISISNTQKNNKEREIILEERKKELESLEKDITLERESIESLKAELSSVTINIKELEENYEKELWELECLKLKILKDKMPVSREEREKSLRKSIDKFHKSIAEKQENLKNYHRQRKEKSNNMMKLNNNISSIKAEIENSKTLRQNYSKSLEISQKKIRIATNALKTVTEKKEKALEKLKSIENSYNQNCEKLQLVRKCDVMYKKCVLEHALQSFNNENPKKKIELSKYHGFVIDCFECSHNAETAILAVASEHLFDFVFDYKKDVNAVLKRVKGDCNLDVMSLDLLEFSNKNLPKFPDTFPLIKQIEYDPFYEQLVKFIFGNVLVCRNNRVAFNISKKHKITCVTTRGNVFFPNGVSKTINWNENERNQISIYKLMVDQQDDFRYEKQEIEQYVNQESYFKNTISETVEQKTLLELQIEDNEKRRILLENELDMLETELCYITVDNDEHNEILNSIEILTERIEKLELKLNNYDEEQMTSKEDQRYKELEVSTKHLLELRKKEEKKFVELNKKINNGLTVLQETFLKMKYELQRQIPKIIVAIEMEINQITDELAELEFNIKESKKKNEELKKLQTEIDQLQEEINKKEIIKHHKSNIATTIQMEMDVYNIEMDHLKAELSEMQNLIKEAQRKRNDGSKEVHEKSDSELENIKKLTMQQLSAFQRTVDSKLKKISNDINKNTSAIFDIMQEMIQNSEAAIKQLDDDQIQMTAEKEYQEYEMQQQIYRELFDINRYLTFYIERFMPPASAQLTLMTNDRDYTVVEAHQYNMALDDFIGASIMFTEFENGPTLRLDKLSDGQNIILSLALNLAIRKCYETSLMLCDEIDQVLDVTNQEILLGIFKEMTSGGQIFVQTYRPEVVNVGDCFYEVKKNGATSEIKRVNRQGALDFLETAKEKKDLILE